MHEINVKSLAEYDLMVLCKAYCDTEPCTHWRTSIGSVRLVRMEMRRRPRAKREWFRAILDGLGISLYSALVTFIASG